MTEQNQLDEDSLQTAALFVAACLVPGQLLNGLGPLLFGTQWYHNLVKPAFHPPGFWLFVIIFVVNYSCMGLAAWSAWKRRRKVQDALRLAAGTLFVAQLAVGFGWTLIVYSSHSIYAGFVLDVLDDVLYLSTMFAFAKISSRAVLWLIPPAAWFAFTTYLKYIMWQLNG